MKLNRNTAAAAKRASEVKREKRQKLQKRIAENIIPDHCQHGDSCPGAIDCGRDVFKQCTSYNDLAGSLTARGVETLSGKKSKWSPSMVKNLFLDFYDNFR